MKKALIAVLASAALLCAHAQNTFEKDGVTYLITGETTAGINKVNSALTEVILPETVENAGASYSVTTVETYAFNSSKATKIVIPNSVTEIKRSGMYGAGEVTDLTLSNNLKTLGDFAFAYCRKLTSITLPEGLETVPASCFASCDLLESATLPSSVKTIGGASFYKTALKEFTFPASCDSVGKNPFQSCAALTKVTFNENLRVLSEGTFRECPQLATINLEAAKKLEALPSHFFLDATALTSVTIPESVKSFGIGAFAGTSINEFKLVEGNTHLTIINEAIYSADKSILHAFPPKSSATEFSVAAGCLGIGGGAFDGAQIEKVTLPSGIRAFDDNAFMNTPLKEMNFPSSLVYMGAYALANTAFTSITLPEEMIAINEGLLAQCPNLASVTIPFSVRDIDIYAFRQSERLTEVRCLSAQPPQLYYYESYEHPFYRISDEAVLSVPKGTIEAYSKSGYSKFKEIVDNEPAIFVPETFSPAKGAELKVFERATLTFSEETIIVNKTPKVTLIKGNELSGKIIKPEKSWSATIESNKKTANIFGQDYDGYLETFSLEAGETYFLTIPAGTFKNTAGDLNQKIVLKFAGKKPVPFSYESVTPDNETALKKLGTIEFTFAQKVKTVISKPAIVLRKGNAAEGEIIKPEHHWGVYASTTNSAANVFAADIDGDVSPITMEAGADYYLTIPAGVLKSEDDELNQEIVLHYTGWQSTPFSYENATPADNSKLEEISSIDLSFAKPVSIRPNAPAIEWGVTTADMVPTSESVWSVADNSEDGKTMTLTTAAPIKLETVSSYMLLVPAGTFEDAEGNMNSEIKLNFYGKDKETGVANTISDHCVVLVGNNSIEVQLGTLANCKVQLYNANGMLIESIERAAGNVVLQAEATGVYIVNISLEGKTQAFKVVK